MIVALSGPSAGWPLGPSSPGRKLGALWAFYGLICLTQSAWIMLNDATLSLMWGSVVSQVANPFAWMSAFRFFLVGVIALLIVAGAVAIFAGVSLAQGHASSRKLALIASFLGIITGPLGIALGVYTLVLLLPSASWQLYERYRSAA
jgi:hypothetical protein